MPSIITVCTTCKFAAGQPLDANGQSGGAQLADALEAEARNWPDAPGIVRHECLWACTESCAILIGEAGKTGYLAGRFQPTSEAAAAILDWVAAYAESEIGTVRYARWPEGMKGHFIARIPAA